MGAKVAVQVDADRHLFVEGIVYEAVHSPPQFLVKYLLEQPEAAAAASTLQQQQQAWLKRPQVRLLLPPWWEEINHPNFSPALTSTPGKTSSVKATYHHFQTVDNLKYFLDSCNAEMTKKTTGRSNLILHRKWIIMYDE